MPVHVRAMRGRRTVVSHVGGSRSHGWATHREMMPEAGGPLREVLSEGGKRVGSRGQRVESKEQRAELNFHRPGTRGALYTMATLFSHAARAGGGQMGGRLAAWSKNGELALLPGSISRAQKDRLGPPRGAGRALIGGAGKLCQIPLRAKPIPMVCNLDRRMPNGSDFAHNCFVDDVAWWNVIGVGARVGVGLAHGQGELLRRQFPALVSQYWINRQPVSQLLEQGSTHGTLLLGRAQVPAPGQRWRTMGR